MSDTHDRPDLVLVAMGLFYIVFFMALSAALVMGLVKLFMILFLK